MKNLITIILLVFTFTMSAQVDSTLTVDTETITEAERIIDKYSGKIAESFNQGVEKMVPIAEDAFKIAVRLQIGEGIARMLPLLLFLICLMTFQSEYNRITSILEGEKVPEHMNRHYGPFDDANLTPKLVLFAVLSIALLIATISTIYGGIVRLIAPEWFAIKEIIEMFN